MNGFTDRLAFAPVAPLLEPGVAPDPLPSCNHRHRLDKYLLLDTLLINQTAWKVLPQTIAKSGNHKMADCPSYY